MKALIEGCTPKEASGEIKARAAMNWLTERQENVQTEELEIGGKDVARLLRAAVGRQCKMVIEIT